VWQRDERGEQEIVGLVWERVSGEQAVDELLQVGR
jgi:hypothetical protein